MASVEIFCQNVKAILAQRSIRMKDLAERIGLSESYLSLVLNGTRKNLNDEYKDRIASYLDLSLSQLYSEDLGATMAKPAAPVFVEDPDRKETTRLIDTFLTTTNLSGARPSFYVALSGMNDKESRTVRGFFRTVLADLTKDGDTGSPTAPAAKPLPEAEKRLLAIYSLAGDNSRLEWVKSASALAEAEFMSTTQELVAESFLEIRDDSGVQRASTRGHNVTASSTFTLATLRDVHFSLASAMVALPDEGPFFEKAVAEHFVRAGRSRKALEHLSRAAKLLESSGLWREAAETWHQASILHGALDDSIGRGNCLAEAAKCLGATGDFDEANEFGSYACRVAQEMGMPRAVGYVSIMMGYMLGQHDPGAAIEWYRKGLRMDGLDDVTRGTLLGNLVSTLLEAERLGEAENTVREARRWSSGRSVEDIGNLREMIPIGLGLIEFRRRNWKLAKQHFEDALAVSGRSKHHMALACWNMGMLMYRDDSTKASREYLIKAQDAYSELGMKLYWAYASIEMAKVALREGDFEEAVRRVNAAEPLLEEKSVLEKGWVSLIRSCIGRAQGRQAQAIEYGRKAVDTFQREESERDLAVAALWISRLYQEAGDPQQATFMERRAFQIYEKRHWDVRELHRERSLLEPQAG